MNASLRVAVVSMSLLGAPVLCEAQSTIVYNVNNHSFESGIHDVPGVPPEGWTSVAPNINDAIISSTSVAGASDGTYAATVLSGGGTSYLFQNVGPIVAGYDYVLTVSVLTLPNGLGGSSWWSFQLQPFEGNGAGDGNAYQPLLVPGIWTDRSAVLSAGHIASENLTGQQLEIRLGFSQISSPYPVYDNVRLTLVAVPEPGTAAFLILGSVALGLLAGRKTKEPAVS